MWSTSGRALACWLALSFGASLRAGPPIVFRGARILTAAEREGAKVYDPGAIVVQDGKITALGPAEEMKVPEGATVRDVAGRVIIPGLVDTHSHLGVMSRPFTPASSDGNESSGP